MRIRLGLLLLATAGTAWAAAPESVARDGWPLAGRAGEYFYLRDSDDEFRLYLQGRAHIDGYWPLGPGVSDLAAGNGAKPTFFLRRARLELSGEFLRDWQWTIGGDFGQSAADSANQAPAPRTAPTDLFVNYRALPELNFEIGQIKIPFTLENRTSENITPFLENSLAVRNLGAPTVRDIGAMLWGEAAERLVYYTVGIFNGDGPNRPNQDANFDAIGRVVVHPFARAGVKELEGLEFGASVRYGVRSAKTVGYEVNAFTTQGGFAFWRPRYTDSKNELIHIIPSSAQRAYAAELYFPIAMVDLSAEVVAVDQGTREAIDGYALTWPFTERYGTLAGFAHYVELGIWVFGDRQFVRKPGYLDPVHVDFSQPLRPSRNSLEVLARFEQLRVRYDAAARAGTRDPMTPNGDIRVDTLSFGVNYWATRRVRLSLNYELNSFPDGAPALHGGHVLHELGMRVGVGF